MILLVSIESKTDGGFICYDVSSNKILWQYKGISLRGGVLYENYLIMYDTTTIYYFNITNWKLEKTYSQKHFNDLKYLFIHNEHLYIMNSGLDCVDILDYPLYPVFNTSHYIFDLPQKHFKQRFIDSEIDYRDTKILEKSCGGEEIWVSYNHLLVSCSAPGNCIIDMKTNNIVVDNIPCHNLTYDRNNLYVTSYNIVYIINRVMNRKWPVTLNEQIELPEGTWRGGIAKSGFLVLFSSANVAIIKLKTKEVTIQRLPVFEKIMVYQPILWEQ